MIYETERALWHHLIGVGPIGETAAMNPIKKASRWRLLQIR